MQLKKREEERKRKRKNNTYFLLNNLIFQSSLKREEGSFDRIVRNMLEHFDAIIHVHPVCDACDVPITARRCDSIFPAREHAEVVSRGDIRFIIRPGACR